MDCENCENVKLDKNNVCTKCKLKLCSYCKEQCLITMKKECAIIVI